MQDLVGGHIGDFGYGNQVLCVGVLALDCGCVIPGSGSGRGVTLKTVHVLPQVHCVWRWVTLETVDV